MFPVDKRLAQNLWYAAPDVIPAMCLAVDDVAVETWNAHDDLESLAEAIAPDLARRGVAVWDFVWSMERHFSDPYGPLPKARETFMAGIPDMFLRHHGGAVAGATGAGASGGVLDQQAAINRVASQDDVTVEAAPYAFEAGSDMPDDYRVWLEKLFFAHGECMIPYFGEAAKGIKSMFQETDAALMEQAPDAASRMRFSNFTNEEYRHTYQFYELYNAYDTDIPYRIYEHETQVFRAYMDLKTDGSWIDYAIFNMLADRLGTYQAFEWVQSSYAPLARLALKAVKDERGHCNMGYLNVREFMAREGDDGRSHVQRRVDEHFYPFHLAAFGSDDSTNNVNWRRWGLKQNRNDALRAAYHDEMTLVFESLGLAPPDFDDARTRGFERVQEMRRQAAAG
jgi:1,2-phenylacetyl-CoA epoxidase catalytic subunit